MRGSLASAWAMVTRRCSTGVSVPAICSVRTPSSATRSSSSRARWCSLRPRSTPPRDGMPPSSTFSATEWSSISVSSWGTRAMPAWSAWRGVCDDVSSPAMAIVPASGFTIPARTFMSVDLPAPFAPMSPTTSPSATRSVTPSSARTASKCFVIEVSSTRASAAGGSTAGGATIAVIGSCDRRPRRG